MALGIATGQAKDGESVSEATALIEGGDGREAWVVIGSIGNGWDALPEPWGLSKGTTVGRTLCGHRLDDKPLRCFARTPTLKLSGGFAVAKRRQIRRLERIVGHQ